jgi:hypothetical protein
MKGRKPKPFKTKRLPLTLIERSHRILERLVATGGYGNNATEAAKIIITRHIQELDQSGRLAIFSDMDEAPKGNKG